MILPKKVVGNLASCQDLVLELCKALSIKLEIVCSEDSSNPAYSENHKEGTNEVVDGTETQH